MKTAKFERGNWRVMRDCCHSGNCIECRGTAQRPHRIVQGDGYSKAYAERVAHGWRELKATVEKMPGAEQ